MTTSTQAWRKVTDFKSTGALLDPRALGELFRQHGPAVCRRAQRILGNNADAQEATQEVFLRALRSAESFEGRSQITTWLYQITTYHCLNQLRDRRRRQQLMDEQLVATEPGRSTSAASPAELILLRQLLAEADEQQARAAVYVYLDELTHEEAAELLEVSPRTVGNLLERFRGWAADRVAESAGKSRTRVAESGRRRSP